MSERRLRRLPSDFWLALLTCICVCVVQVLWLRADQRPPMMDAGTSHLPNVLAVMGRLPSHVSSSLDYYPPFVYLAAAPLVAIFGEDPKSAVLSLQAWVLLMGMSAWWLGRRLGGPSNGLLATFLVLTLPHLSGFSLEFYLDYPLAAVTLFTTACINEVSVRRRGDLALGVPLGIGLLVKWVFAGFVAWPLGRLYIECLRDTRDAVTRVVPPTVVLLCALAAHQTALRASSPTDHVLSLLLLYAICATLLTTLRHVRAHQQGSDRFLALHQGLLVAMCIATPWYVTNFRFLSAAALALQDVPLTHPWNALQAAIFLPGVPVFAVAVLGLLSSLRDPHQRSLTHLAVQATLGGWLVDLTPYKETRYLLPDVPLITMIAATWLSSGGGVGARWVKTPIAGALVCLGVISTVAWRLVPDAPDARWLNGATLSWKCRREAALVGSIEGRAHGAGRAYALPLLGMRPETEPWPTAEVARVITPKGRQKVRVTLVPGRWEDSALPYGLRYEAARRGVDLLRDHRPSRWVESDFVIVPDHPALTAEDACRGAGVPWPPGRQVARFSLHGPTHLEVFARDPEPSPSPSPARGRPAPPSP